MSPLLILVIGIALVLGLIIRFRVNAFLALIVAAFVVSILVPGSPGEKISRVATAFGDVAGSIGIVIALAALIGRLMLDSGAADRIVSAFLSTLGEKRGGTALTASGYVLSIPVFFDTVFYLLVPLARSMYRKTGHGYIKYLLAIVTGAALTHTLVPPTPGPLVIADTLGVNLGTMILVGIAVGLPAAVCGLLFAGWVDRKMKLRLRYPNGDDTENSMGASGSPGLLASLLPILLPIVLVTTGSILSTLADAEHAARFKAGDIREWRAFTAALQAGDSGPATRVLEALPAEVREHIIASPATDEAEREVILSGLNAVLLHRDFHDPVMFAGTPLSEPCRQLLQADRQRMPLARVERLNRLLMEAAFPQIRPHEWETPLRRAADAGAFFGNPNFALLIAAIAALAVYLRQRRPSRKEVSRTVESALMSGGIIILITAAGGAFGAMLGLAKVGPAIEGVFPGGEGLGRLGLLLLAFVLASLLKFAQGSSTVAMITAAGTMAAMVDPQSLGFHPVYLALAVGSGSLVGSWMNDSGFWIFCKMGGLTEAESLRSWTPLLAICGIVAMGGTILLAILFPLGSG
jgi:H+/gluconate symporter-like permease